MRESEIRGDYNEIQASWGRIVAQPRNREHSCPIDELGKSLSRESEVFRN